jgi:hypothetical protein
MKRLIILMVLLLPILGHAPASPRTSSVLVVRRFAEFAITYQKIRYYEGYYANDPADPGGKTYAGITYRWNPDWYGWRYIDFNKIKYNERVEACEIWILDYYLDIWVSEGFYKLKNQSVANYLFDMRVNNSRKTTIKLCNKLKGVSVKYQEEWVTEKLDSIDLKGLSRLRTNHYHNLVRNSPEKRKFLDGWLRRSTDIA